MNPYNCFKRYNRFNPIGIGFLFVFSFFGPLLAQEPTTNAIPNENKNTNQKLDDIFLRITRSPDGTPQALETSAITLKPEDGAYSVTLIGAVHLGEKAYYETLNAEFKKYDVVLYEMVAQEGSTPTDAKESGGVIGRMQRTVAKMLGLEFQIGSIDYTPKNMLHADMTPDEFQDAMQKRDDSFWKMYLRILAYSLSEDNTSDGSEVRFLAQLLSSNQRQMALRCFFAEEIVDLPRSIIPIEGENGSALIQDRNEKVVRILGEQIRQNKQKIAIFYGSAHLPHFIETLKTQFQLQQKEITWFPAWNLVQPVSDEKKP